MGKLKTKHDGIYIVQYAFDCQKSKLTLVKLSKMGSGRTIIGRSSSILDPIDGEVVPSFQPISGVFNSIHPK